MTDPPTVLAMAEALRIAREALTLTATESDCAAATEGCLERVPNAPGAWCDVSDINPDDEADHPRLERLQDLVRAGKAWQKAALTLAHAEGRWICPDCGGCWSNPSDDLTVGMRYRCAICGEVTIATSPRPWPATEGAPDES